MIPSNPIQSDMTRPITTDRYCSRRAWSQEISILITIAAHYPGRVLVILRVVIVEMREKGRIYSYVTAIFTGPEKKRKEKKNQHTWDTKFPTRIVKQFFTLIQTLYSTSRVCHSLFFVLSWSHHDHTPMINPIQIKQKNEGLFLSRVIPIIHGIPAISYLIIIRYPLQPARFCPITTKRSTQQQPFKTNTSDFRSISTNYSNRVTRTLGAPPRVEDTREHVPVFGTRGPTIAKDARALAAPGRSATPGRVRGPRRRWWMAFEGWSREKERQRGGYGEWKGWMVARTQRTESSTSLLCSVGGEDTVNSQSRLVIWVTGLSLPLCLSLSLDADPDQATN